ncbi:unnamed protein product [Closterium sp. NIES-54]
MGTKEAFVEMKPGGDVKHARGFNGVLQNFEGHGIVALRMDIGEQILVPVVLYVPVVQANLLFAGQLKDSDVKLQDVGGEMLLISAVGDVLGRIYGLRQAPREWHDTLRTTLAALGFASSTADPSLFLRTDTSLPPFYVLVYINDLFSLPQPTPLSTAHLFSAPPLDESVEPSCPYPELMGCLMYLMTCIRPDLAYPLSLLARYVAPGRHRKVHWDAAKRVLRYLCGTSGMGLMLGGRGPVVLSGHADASWELRWLTYLLTDLGEQPRSPPFLYVDNKAMISLCLEHKLEHRTKHIPLRYFLARELQQRGQLCLAYVATRANTADIFTKALPPGDHQRFSTVLGLVPTLPDLLTV